MWMMTPRGFYSAVQKRADHGTPYLTVRARSKKDLENLADLLPADAKPYREERWTDYPWRVRVTVGDWTKVCAILATEIDYDNFKDAVKDRQGKARANVYSRVWSALLSIERERSAKVPKTYAPAAFEGFDDYPTTEDLGLLIDSREQQDETARAERHRVAGTRTAPRRRAAKGKR